MTDQEYTGFPEFLRKALNDIISGGGLEESPTTDIAEPWSIATDVLLDTGPMHDGPYNQNCPVCGAIGPDYCEIVRCKWNMTDAVTNE